MAAHAIPLWPLNQCRTKHAECQGMEQMFWPLPAYSVHVLDRSFSRYQNLI